MIRPRKHRSNAPATEAASLHWMHDIPCVEEDPELFFPGRGEDAAAQIEEAKAVCARCPSRDECGKWAIESGWDEGIFGGTTPEERRQLRRKLRRKKAS